VEFTTMPDRRAPRLEAERSLRILQHLYGSTRPKILITVVIMVVLFGLCTNAITNLVTQFVVMGAAGRPFQLRWDAVFIVLFAILAWILWRRASQAGQWVTPEVIRDDSPQQMRGLILFLSPIGKDLELVQELSYPAKDAAVPASTLLDLALRERFQGSWRMALEAIAQHRPRLSHVIVIGSSTLTNQKGKSFEGTEHLVQEFKCLVKAVAGSEPLTVDSIGDALKHLAEAPQGGENWGQGINFEDVDELVRAIEAAFQSLVARKILNYEICVDVTGGQKPPTIAGAIATLAVGRRCQYVSRHDYHVKTFDVTYLP